MARGDVEVVHVREGWRIVIQGTYHTQEHAEWAANQIAKKLKKESFVRGLKGFFLRRNTYGHDPAETKD